MNALQEDNFDYLITSDKNLQYQQNISKYTFGFIVFNVMNNNYETVLPLVDKIKQALIDEVKVKLKIIANT